MSIKGHMTNVFPEYLDGRTKQAFKDQCDINKIMQKYQRTGMLSHLAAHQAQYMDVAELDYHTAQTKIAQANQLFDSLPVNVKKEFRNDPGAFVDFVSDPANAGRLGELLPDLAAPGRQLPDIRKATTAAAVAKEGAPGTTPAPAASPGTGD